MPAPISPTRDTLAEAAAAGALPQADVCYVSIRQHTSAYERPERFRKLTYADVC
jgi:hypothetical protein